MPKYAFLIASVVTGLSACDRQPVAPSDPEAPAYNWMNNPDVGNIRITRFEEGFIACWSDATNGLRACHSTIPLGDGTLSCGPQAVLDPIQVQQVGLIDELDFFASWLHHNTKGTVWITVRDLTQPGDCAGNRLVAEGWGTVHYTDNDLFGTAPGDRNANAWGFIASGKLTAPDGETVGYTGQTHLRVNNAVGFKETSARVSIH